MGDAALVARDLSGLRDARAPGRGVRRLERRGLLLGIAAPACAVMPGGVPPLGAAFQFLFTMLAGATFIRGAVGARSLRPAMVVHALYDAVAFDLARLVVAGAGHGPLLALGGIALVPGVRWLVRLRSLDGAEPYAR